MIEKKQCYNKKEGVKMAKYQVGEIIVGNVTGIEKYGVFVNLDEYYSGLIHISEISDSFVKNIHDYVKVGETIKVKVLEENEKEHQVKLSIKDFDYRIGAKKNNRIKETKSGFSTLKIMLDKWIEMKDKELSNNNIQKTEKK